MRLENKVAPSYAAMLDRREGSFFVFTRAALQSSILGRGFGDIHAFW